MMLVPKHLVGSKRHPLLSFHERLNYGKRTVAALANLVFNHHWQVFDIQSLHPLKKGRGNNAAHAINLISFSFRL